ncbi:Uncharacterized protein dnl_30910 [Desulfonema limicola]|uniref:Uncharacterized protein n=1 Tax=Desulfonema limicola TaxID=45656 RepID=A0A975B8G6_9BACT|nr:hypothetical protein [Desulfonema limicola]QTA80778.1 Uncharacterized protein dnl_30910 [Desulfonema limicola]
MIESINTEVRSKLEEIGFEKDEISAIAIIHELKIGKYPVDINEFLNKTVSKKIRDELLEKKIDELSWEMGEKNFSGREEIYDR